MAAQKAIKTTYADGQTVWSNVRNNFDAPIFDKNQTITLTKVDTWYDGSPMDDTKVDGKVWLKMKTSQGGGYARVDLPSWGENFLEKDTVESLRDMTPTEMLLLIARYYKGVRLSGYYEKGDTPEAIDYYISATSATDDGGSVFDVGVIKLEHEFVGEINVKYFGATGIITQDAHSYVLNVFKHALLKSLNIYHPSGTYNFYKRNSPYKTLDTSLNDLFDCKNITIRGDGDATVLMTETPTGADVLNLHKVKNLTIRDLSITGIVSGSTLYGTNGISVVSGYDNINIINVSVRDLYGIQNPSYPKVSNKGDWNATTNTPSLLNSTGGTIGDWYTVSVAGTQNFGGSTSFSFEVGDEVIFANGVWWKQSFYVDGGKALTIQNGDSPLELGSLKADIRVYGCAYGFGIDFYNHNFVDKKTAIEVNMIAEKCHRGVSLDGNYSTTIPTPVNKIGNVVVNAQTVNCQEDYFGRNVLGVTVNVKSKTTQTAEERRKTPDGSRYWNTTNKKVTSIRAYNQKYCQISISGDKGECDSKYEIGGELIPSTGGIGSCEQTIFSLNVLGSATTPFNLINAGGSYIRNCVLNILSENLQDLPELIFWNSRNNTISTKEGFYAPTLRSNTISLNADNTKDGSVDLKYSPIRGAYVALKNSGAGLPILSLVESSGSNKFRFLNNGNIEITDSTGAVKFIMSGIGNPEGVTSANPGTIYIRSGIVGGNYINSEIFIKRSGVATNTGWVRLDGNATTTIKGLVNQSAKVDDVSTTPPAPLSAQTVTTIEQAQTAINNLVTMVNAMQVNEVELKAKLNAKFAADRAAGIQSTT